MSSENLRQTTALAERLERWSDVFEDQVSQRTNTLDIASHYPFSPERWRLSVDGTRQLVQYGSVPQYTHDTDRHLLQPAAGETVALQTAERPRYVVQYELACSFAFSITQSLASGDSIKVGLYNGADGWYFEQNGSHTDATGDFVMERDGSEVYRESDVDIRVPTTQFARLALFTGWYDITRQQWERSYAEEVTRDGRTNTVQQNRTVAKAAAPDARGPRKGNLPLRFEVTASSATTGLTLNAGSCAQVNLGETTQFNRSKKFFATDSVTVTDAWEPLRAFRVDPARDVVTVQLSNVSIGKYSTSDDVELLMLAGDTSNVLDTNGDQLTDADFSVPNETSPQNSVIEESTAVEQFPDSTGTPQTSMTNPGGWQLARSELLSESKRALASAADIPVEAKRPIYDGDIAVILAKSGTAGDISYQLQTEQDW